MIRSQNVYNDGFHHSGLAHIDQQGEFWAAKVEIGPELVDQRFNLPALHAELVNRIVIGSTVIDHERVRGIRPQSFEVAACYRVVDGLIRTVWFLSGD